MELIDVLDNNGKKIGKVIDKDIAHRDGIWHGAIHLLIISEDRRCILLQKRCSLKKLFPDMWDVSVGGHIKSRESSLESLNRETEEELGLIVGNLKVKKIKRIKEEFYYNNIHSCEFVDLYLTYYSGDLSNIKMQEEEVSDVRWFTKEEFNKLIEKKEVVNHQEEFIIINELLK